MNILNYLFWGILAAFGSLILETAVSIFFPQENIVRAVVSSINYFLVASIVIEEILKFSVILASVSEKDEKLSFFLKSFFIGLGFSLFEVILNLYGISPKNIGLPVALSLLGIFLIHILTTCYMGYFIAIFYDSKKVFFAAIIIFTSFLHFAYNFAIVYNIPILFVHLFFCALSIILILRYFWLKLAKYKN